MTIKARKITVVVIDKNGNNYFKEAVEFYDDTSNTNVDPTKTDLTADEVTKMTNDAFDGNKP